LSEAEQDWCKEDDIARARRLAQTHRLGPAYLGQGVCQPSDIDIRFPGDVPYNRFSKMSMSQLAAVRGHLEAAGDQLGILDVEEAMRQAA